MDTTKAAADKPGTLLAILAAMLVSVLSYGLLFGLGLHKPLSVGTIRDYFELKTTRAAALPSPKLMFLGGSNVRFGLSCKLVERETGMPCVNAGFLADVGMDLMVERFEPLLHAGDVVYIPLAYEQYLWDRDFVETQRDAAYLFAYDRETLSHMPFSRQLHALFHFDLPFMASALAENVLAAIGLRRQAGGSRNFGAKNLNEWGDETGHTAEQGRVFEALIAASSWKLPPLDAFTPERFYYTQALEGFIARVQARGVTVVGGLVQVADDVEIDPRIVERIRAIYERNGAGFIELPNRSQYPRQCFFDSIYHLNEECQWRHTADLLPALRPYLPESG